MSATPWGDADTLLARRPAAGLRLVVETLIGFAAAQPVAARLWLVDAYGAGPAAVDAAEDRQLPPAPDSAAPPARARNLGQPRRR